MHDVGFETPGPGSWERESTHVSRPISRWLADVMPPAHMRGFAESLERYGALLAGIDVAVVNGFLYHCLRPVGAPKDATGGPPPKWVFKLLLRLHPALRRRVRAGARVFEDKLWREDVARWDTEWKPALAATNRALQAVDPRSLSMTDLAEHHEACRAAYAHAVYRHHTLDVPSVLPAGDFLVHAQAWTGRPLLELLALLRGSTPVSVGATGELNRLAEVIRRTPGALAVLEARAPAGAVLDALARLPGEVGPALGAYLDLTGLRIVGGYDVADQSAIELPEVLVNAIRSVVEGAAATAETGLEERTAPVRDGVPAAQRDAFDALLAEARFAHRLRDERGLLNDAWTGGIARRALLEAGRRLAEASRLEAPEHAPELTPAEVTALLAGKPGPSAQDVAARFAWRTGKTLEDAPERLGAPPASPPPVEWLPPATARGARAIMLAMQAMFECAAAKSSAKVIRGLAASPGRREGIARVVPSPADFARVERGDILVAATTAPSYNVLLPILAGIVTDRGGLLSHAAIVAREYGLPAVVGTAQATRRIPDGARVRIDGSRGEVELLA